MKRLIAPRMERCIGCHSCSLSCAREVHQRLSWDTAGIRIHSAGGMSTGFEARTCLACQPAPCAEACPTGAYTQRRGGGVMVRKKLCIRCGACETACPVNAIFLDATGEPFVCLHCGRCIAYCPHDCLEMADIPGTAGSEQNNTFERKEKLDVLEYLHENNYRGGDCSRLLVVGPVILPLAGLD